MAMRIVPPGFAPVIMSGPYGLVLHSAPDLEFPLHSPWVNFCTPLYLVQCFWHSILSVSSMHAL